MTTHVEEVAEGTFRLITRIPGMPTLFSIYIIKETSGVLIEPGPAALIPAIQDAINGLGLGSLEYIIPTHIHLDHAGAVGRLSQLFPQAKVVVHPQGVNHIVDPTRLIQSTRMAFGEDFETIYGEILPVPESRVKIVEDKERLSVDSREVMIIHTPGHAPHHMAVFDIKTRGLFCGEALGLLYSDSSEPLPAVAPPALDVEAYLSSMERLRQLNPRLLFYSHGNSSDEPEKAIPSVIKNTKTVGEAILGALKTGETEEAVIRNIGEYIWKRFGVRLEEYDLASNVRGYIHYFKKKGLV